MPRRNISDAALLRWLHTLSQPALKKWLETREKAQAPNRQTRQQTGSKTAAG